MQTEQINKELMLEKSARILELVGSSKADALSVAESLVDAQAAGHSSHGILRLVEYADSVKSGQVIPNAQPRIISERGAVVTLEAQLEDLGNNLCVRRKVKLHHLHRNLMALWLDCHLL